MAPGVFHFVSITEEWITYTAGILVSVVENEMFTLRAERQIEIGRQLPECSWSMIIGRNYSEVCVCSHLTVEGVQNTGGDLVWYCAIQMWRIMTCKRWGRQDVLWLMYPIGKTRIKWLQNKKKIPVGARFFAHVQTGPGAHPASCTMGTGSFPGVKWLGRGADHPPPSSTEVTKG